ncbi:MAG: methionyl-tRNA formyltransferase [Bacteroidaceae bacterium]|nr:methionyl-tRNA formyltransferase [Bacteroidaceae bacterium]
MIMENLRIVYLGTPDFAVEPLRRLIEKQKACAECGYEVVGVVTMPDKMINKRGNQLLMSPVKQYATSEGLPVLQPELLKDETFQNELRALRADLQIVVAFRMLPESVWNMPRLGTFNLHASLLPQYRGAAPINWAIINGDKETGVTTFFLKHEIDTGDVIYRDVIAIEENDNAGTLHDKLMLQGGETVLRTVEAIVNGDVKAIAQDTMFATEQELRPAPKIFRDTCRIDWEKDVCAVYDFVRGMSPYPAAWLELADAEGKFVAVKVYEVVKEFSEHDFEIGTLLTDNKSYAKVAVKGGYVSLVDVQLAGKKRMPVADLLRGFPMQGMTICK